MSKKTHAMLLCSVLSTLSSSGLLLAECIIKAEQKLIIAEVQSSCGPLSSHSHICWSSTTNIGFTTSLSLFLFLPLSLSLSLSLSPLSPESIYVLVGWLFSSLICQHWRGLNLLCAHPLSCFAPMHAAFTHCAFP